MMQLNEFTKQLVIKLENTDNFIILFFAQILNQLFLQFVFFNILKHFLTNLFLVFER